MNLAAAFAESARLNHAKPAIHWGEEVFDFAHTLRKSTDVAHFLKEHHGVKPGDRVGIWLKNCPEYVSCLFGIFLCGGVAVPMNAFFKPPEAAHVATDASMKVVFTEAALAEGATALQALVPGLTVVNIASIGTGPVSEIEMPTRTRDDVAILIYTSGTTGRPKGVMLTHGNMLENVESCRQMLLAVPYDRFAVILPMFHSFMMCVSIMLPMLIGGSMVIVRSLSAPKALLAELIQNGATILPAMPQFYRTLTALPVPENLPLRLCISGAAPLPHEILREFTAKYPIPLLEGYGLSEASPVVSFNPIQGPWKAGSIGKPVPNVEVGVQDDAGNFLPDNAVGEIVVRGGNVMKGYWNQPDETSKAMRDGWLLTGDIGYRDVEGYYFITDRKKDMLLVNGINVYPREIEEVIYQFPGIREAAVVSRPDPRKGEQPVACVSVAEGAVFDEKALIKFLKENLADYKVPRRVHVLSALPRNATGKIQKTDLRKWVVDQDVNHQA